MILTPLVQAVSTLAAAEKETVDGPVSPRVAVALDEARGRALRDRAHTRPVLWVLLGSVVCATVAGHPRPGMTGAHLGVSVALAGTCLVIGLAAANVWPLSRPTAIWWFVLLSGTSGLV